ncbi:G patch domain-containing protein 3 [Danio rerio]|uniref:G patch domain-containing protein 3 n=1 Tax=Danio rerio TaxID=7955 RepID=A1L2F7_DANRE|nr:G patch domain-containing protein 3 [Danio rerio]AAI29500.1 Zgc:158863 [Danio rerio]|eukprot:NP_001074099.1 G patch domain-containing protein 3 [Danio rerio]
MAASEEVTYFVVNNIPGRFRSADLRNYFSQFIESGGFACFHYRHRPELRVTSGACEAGECEARPAAPADGKQWSSCCCVVSVRAQDSDRFIRMYSGNQWIDSSGNWLRNTCLIRRVRVSEQSDCDLFPYKTKAELRRHVAQSEQFTESDLRDLPELNPPALMPSGNVGTPVSVFLQLIQSCRLPPRLIRKLGLTFPKTGSNRRYGNVPYQYHNTRVVTPAEESVFTAGGVEIKGHAQRDTPTTSHRKQGKPTTLYRTQETPTASQAKQDTPTISLTIQDTPTTTQTNQDTPSTSCIIQDTPTASQRQQDTPTASQKLDMSTTSCKIQDTPTASQRKQDTPTTSCIIQDTPTTSQTVQDTPTTSQKQDMSITSCKIQDTPTASQRKDTPPTSCIIQETPTTSQTKRLNTPTASRKIQDTPTYTQTLYEDTPSPPVNQPSQEEESEEELSGPDDDDDRCEEWERHEALHEDITAQERSKERLFEEEIELKWEKGGSGLVFYTDAQFWQEEEEGDFDEQTADDWDVDMSVYYDKDGGDMDSRAYVRMRSEQRLRDGLTNTHIGSFERFTKGVGRRLMEKQGWRDGEGLGNSQMGMAEALEDEGQHPHCKRGFGYHGEKLNSFLPAKKPRKDFHISTVYDEPRDIDQGDDLLRRQPNTSMKYRQRRMNNNPNR